MLPFGGGRNPAFDIENFRKMRRRAREKELKRSIKHREKVEFSEKYNTKTFFIFENFEITSDREGKRSKTAKLYKKGAEFWETS